jgi:hypothetical protein
MAAGQPIRTERIVKDGVEYDLAVYQADSGGYLASWFCTKCKCRGGSRTVENSTPAALGRDKGNLVQHHAQAHLIGPTRGR